MGLQKGMLGTAIRTARTNKHLSQEQLAESVGITPTHMKHIESEHRKPSIDVLFSIVLKLDLSLDGLLFPHGHNSPINSQKAERLFKRCTANEQRIIIDMMQSMISNLH